MAQERDVAERDIVRTAAGSYNLSAYEPKPGGREVQDPPLPALPDWAEKLPDNAGGVCNFVKATEA